MREYVDIRVYEDWARAHLDDTWGKPMPLPHGTPPMIRQVVLETDDPGLATLKEMLSADKSGLISVADFRSYDAFEIAQASYLQLIITDFVDAFGEDYGTVYDDSAACPRCGFGRRQVSPLKLDVTRIPKSTSIATTNARGEEYIVSRSLAELMQHYNIGGCKLAPVVHVGKENHLLQWYQLIVTASAGETASPTRFGKDFLRDDIDGEYACPSHHLSGLNLVSEVFLRRSTIKGADILKTHNRFGMLSGAVMPTPILLITHRLHSLMSSSSMRGYGVEVARLIDD